jgi:hypothetical protein
MLHNHHTKPPLVNTSLTNPSARNARSRVSPLVTKTTQVHDINRTKEEGWWRLPLGTKGAQIHRKATDLEGFERNLSGGGVRRREGDGRGREIDKNGWESRVGAGVLQLKRYRAMGREAIVHSMRLATIVPYVHCVGPWLVATATSDCTWHVWPHRPWKNGVMGGGGILWSMKSSGATSWKKG